MNAQDHTNPPRGHEPLFVRDDRVTSRHGPGSVLWAEWVEGYGFCYRLRLDSGMSTGGTVPEIDLMAERRP